MPKRRIRHFKREIHHFKKNNRMMQQSSRPLMRSIEKYLPLLALIAFLPIMILRDFSVSNELRYLSIADEALLNGDWFTFTNNGVVYADKPPLYLWIVMLGKALFGQHCMWFISLFSLIPALVTMRVMRNWLVKECPLPDKGWILTSQLMLITCGLFLGLNVFARMDTLMTLFIVLALHTFFKMFRGEGNFKTQSFLFGLYTFLAIFTKGPVGILMPLLCPLVFLLYKREARSFFHYWNWRMFLTVVVLCGAWFLCVYLEDRNTDYLQNLLFHQTAGRAVDAFHHKKPFYFYLIQIWPNLAPYSLLLVGIIAVGMFKHRLTSDTEHFWNATIWTTFVMLSLVSGKLGVYLAPIVPFFVFLTAALIRKFPWNGWLAASVAFPAGVMVLALPALVGIVLFSDLSYLGQPFFYIAAGIFSIAGVLAIISIKQRNLRKALNTIGFSILIGAFAGGFSIPALNPWIGYRDLCEKAVELKEEKGLEHFYSIYLRRSENTDVFLGEDIRQLDNQKDAVNQIENLHNTVLLLPERQIEKRQSLKTYLQGKEYHAVGPYRIVLL